MSDETSTPKNRSVQHEATHVHVEVTLDNGQVHVFDLVPRASQPITVEYGWHAEPVIIGEEHGAITRAATPPIGFLRCSGPLNDTGIISVERPLVIVLCGSTRFKNEINQENARLTLDGNIVISMGVFGHVDMPDSKLWETDSSDTKRMLDTLHKRKIDLADRVHVVNPGGYIGESTAGEIAYATEKGLLVTYLEPPL